MTEIWRGNNGFWVGDDADGRRGATMLNMRETGQLVPSPYNRFGQRYGPGYHDIVVPEEAARRASLAKQP